MALAAPVKHLVNGVEITVDADSAFLLDEFRWYVGKHGHVCAPVWHRGKNRGLLLHRLIAGLSLTDDRCVDHINRDATDNRRKNLRVCTHSENLCNRRKNRSSCSSSFKGVFWRSSRKCWMVQIEKAGKIVRRGPFSDERAAAMAYDEEAKRLHGEFASTNASLGLL